MRSGLILVLTSTLLVGGSAVANTGTLNKTITTQKQTDKNESATQKSIDSLADQTAAMVDEYRSTLQKIENNKIYNQQVKNLIQSQNAELESIAKQISEVEQTNKDVVPQMISMIDKLDALVASDLPFLPEERQKRLSDLKAMMSRADVSTSEKYRRILEAYQIEAEYGRTIEAYRDNLDLAGKSYTVDFLRIGRIGLIYQTLDGEKSGFWQNESRTWAELDGDYKKAIAQGLRIARKQAAPELIEVPVVAPEVVQ